MLVLLDLNVILDVLGQRQPHYPLASETWISVESGQVQGLIAAHSITTLYYLVARHTGPRQAKAAVDDVLRVFSVAAVDQDALLHALTLGWGDFEDAAQMAAAAKAGADYLITRDPKDFEGGPIPVLQPAEYLALLRGARSRDIGES